MLLLAFTSLTARLQIVRKILNHPMGALHEIVDLLQSYLNDCALKVRQMGRGYAWLDTDTHGSLLDAGNFVRTLQSRQGLQVGCPEEIVYRSNWISREQFEQSAKVVSKSTYGKHLLDLLATTSILRLSEAKKDAEHTRK